MRHEKKESKFQKLPAFHGHPIYTVLFFVRGFKAHDRKRLPLHFVQLKEHKRIKEAGGFITFNGVWRVAGVLATSRALGDFPLKDRRLVVAQPDVLTFNLADLGATFMVLASDGLWDALSNDDAVAFAAPHLDEPLCGARSLVNRAYDIGSLDNISALVVDLRAVVGDSGQGDGRTHVVGE